jgi:uracil-DNA glycosylase family 4
MNMESAEKERAEKEREDDGEIKWGEIRDFFDFLEEVFGDVNFCLEEEKKESDVGKEGKETDLSGSELGKGSAEKKRAEGNRVGIFDRIIRECASLPDPYTAMLEEKTKLLNDIAQRIINCKNCELWKERKKAVPGDGNPFAEVAFVGEAPGYEEDKKGKPFVGKSGELLMKMIKDVLGLERKDVFITNVVRCRPPGNRTPEKEEIEKCSPYLFEELSVVKPKLVVALGAPAAKVILGKDEKISELRGNFFPKGEFMIFVTFHPAYIVRNMSQMEVFEDDFRKIKEFLTSK